MGTGQTQLSIACPRTCSLHPARIGDPAAERLRALREGGAGRVVYRREAEKVLGYLPADTTVQRHFHHYREADLATSVDTSKVEVAPPMLQILDSLINQGYRNARNWKPTIKDTLDAMRMKLSLAGQSAFSDMQAAMEGGLSIAEGYEPEAGPAVSAQSLYREEDVDSSGDPDASEEALAAIYAPGERGDDL